MDHRDQWPQFDQQQLDRLELIGLTMLDAVIDLNVSREEFEIVWSIMRHLLDEMPLDDTSDR